MQGLRRTSCGCCSVLIATTVLSDGEKESPSLYLSAPTWPGQAGEAALVQTEKGVAVAEVSIATTLWSLCRAAGRRGKIAAAVRA